MDLNSAPAPASTSAAAAAAAAPPHKRRHKKRVRNFTLDDRAQHRVIEKQRRESLNACFVELARQIPSLARVRRLSKSLIVKASVDYLRAQRAMRLSALSEVEGLLTERDRLRRSLDLWQSMYGHAGPDQMASDKSTSPLPPLGPGISGLMSVREESFGTFPHGFGENENGPEDGGTLNDAMATAAIVNSPTPALADSILGYPLEFHQSVMGVPAEHQSHTSPASSGSGILLEPLSACTDNSLVAFPYNKPVADITLASGAPTSTMAASTPSILPTRFPLPPDDSWHAESSWSMGSANVAAANTATTSSGIPSLRPRANETGLNSTFSSDEDFDTHLDLDIDLDLDLRSTQLQSQGSHRAGHHDHTGQPPPPPLLDGYGTPSMWGFDPATGLGGGTLMHSYPGGPAWLSTM